MTGNWKIHIHELATGDFQWKLKRGENFTGDNGLTPTRELSEAGAFRALEEEYDTGRLGVTVMTFRREKPDPARNPFAVFEDPRESST